MRAGADRAPAVLWGGRVRDGAPPFRRHILPGAPRCEVAGTSSAAADAVAADAKILRGLVLEALAARGPMTADEIAAAICRSVLSVRPRCTELRKMGRVVGTRERRRNASGHSTAVLALAGSEIR